MSAHEKSKSSFDLLMNRASDVFQALSHPLRLSICFELSTAEQSVSQLCDSLLQPQHSISQHLALLRKQNVVKRASNRGRFSTRLATRRYKKC